MASFCRRVLLVAFLVAAVAAVMVTAACDSNCQTCVLGVCASCKLGYYFGANGCTACGAAHCARCQAVGWCTSCEPGDRLQYISTSDDLTVNKYSNCVNAAAFVNTYAALVAAAAALAYAVMG